MAFVARYHPMIGRGTQAWREQAGVIVWYAELADVLAIKTLNGLPSVAGWPGPASLCRHSC